MFVLDMLCEWSDGCRKDGVLCMVAIKKISIWVLCVI